MSKGLRLTINVVTWLLIGVVLCLAILLAGLRLFGYDIYTVLSGSMEPDIKTGSLVYVKEVQSFTLKEGDTITFMKGNKDTIVTHRIYSIDEQDGQLRFYTYGINNFQRDENGEPLRGSNGEIQYTMDIEPVHERNVLGEAQFTVPYLGYLANFISAPPGMYVAIAFGVLLLLLVFLPDIIFPASKDDGKKAAAVKVTDNEGDESPNTEGEAPVAE